MEAEDGIGGWLSLPMLSKNYYNFSIYLHKFPECITYYIHGILFLSSFLPLDIGISLEGGS
jgi:hypothetical protein